ncbi:BhlA/UviB family holin-like peptide [Enterococcus faecium]|uniref:BhlA/UviB family holin-like peptide n=1 Tax=Enterococcus faecium TaxID=1352 RepID=UPI0003A7F9DF|nr:BhlA/UviB family holin-like peptide [Enterococcus faecium]
MEKLLGSLLSNPEQISFAVLFVILWVWVMRQNDAREKRYQNTIDKLTDALGDVEAIKSTVEKIHEKLK